MLSAKHIKNVSAAAIALVPFLFLFQNCGSTSGTETNTKESSASRESGYTPFGISNSSTGSTFSMGDSTSSGVGTQVVGGSGSGGSAPYDGVNCFAGKFGIAQTEVNSFGNQSNLSISILRSLPLTPQHLIVGSAGISLDFPAASASATHSVNCSVSLSTLRKFFPASYFSPSYSCNGNENNLTTFQCTNGYWKFAGTSCRCRFVFTGSDN